jgi:hypothetical protein
MELPPVRLSLSSATRGQVNIDSGDTYEESVEEQRTGNTMEAELTVHEEQAGASAR